MSENRVTADKSCHIHFQNNSYIVFVSFKHCKCITNSWTAKSHAWTIFFADCKVKGDMLLLKQYILSNILAISSKRRLC